MTPLPKLPPSPALQVGPKIAAREDPLAVAALNKLSDAVGRDMKRAGRAFQAADREARGYLDHSDLVR